MSTNEHAIVIVGGGLAGLCAAHRLNFENDDFVLLEARDRLGGRIYTADETGAVATDGFDLGPSWYWPHAQPAIRSLIDELQLPAFAQASEGDVMFERMACETPHRYSGMMQEQQPMRLVGGTASLVHAIAKRLPSTKVRLNTRVSAMTLLSGGVELELSHSDGRTETMVAGQVIAALPPRLLEATVSFTPAQHQVISERWRATPTWMAPHAKFFALYDAPFWREDGLSGTAQSMVGPMVEMHDATTALGRAALWGFIGLSADQRAAIGEEALKQACLDQFVRLYGVHARRPRSTIIKDWTADAFTATSADRVASGHLVGSAEPWVTGPWSERLALAGSETSPAEAGYLAGAVIAADRAVAEVLAKLDGQVRVA